MECERERLYKETAVFTVFVRPTRVKREEGCSEGDNPWLNLGGRLGSGEKGVFLGPRPGLQPEKGGDGLGLQSLVEPLRPRLPRDAYLANNTKRRLPPGLSDSHKTPEDVAFFFNCRRYGNQAPRLTQLDRETVPWTNPTSPAC